MPAKAKAPKKTVAKPAPDTKADLQRRGLYATEPTKPLTPRQTGLVAGD